MEKLRVAVLDIQPITPPVGGGRIRLMGLYSGMDSTIDVHYIGSYDWRGPEYRELRHSEGFLETEVPLSEEHFSAHDRLAARLGRSCIDSAFPLQGDLSPEFIRKAREEAESADIVVFSHQWLFPFVAPVLDSDRQLIVYDSQNCEGLLKSKLLDDGSRAADEVCRAVVRSEWELCRAADAVLACSELDKNSFVRLYGTPPDNILSVPNGVFTGKTKPVSTEEKEELRKKLGLTKNTLCFIGSGYEPNAEAARLVIETAALLPDCDFLILGGVGEMLRDFDRAAHPNVTVTGFLEEQDKLDRLHACDLALNPMLSGSGTNIKMFDFMAAGLPIITTDVGARGIDNTNGTVYALCGRSAAELAEAIRALLADGELRSQLAGCARREAEERYSWERLSDRLGKTLRHLCERKRGAAKKALMISSYPPETCGIGAYARQQTAYMRENGWRVDVLAIKGNGKYTAQPDTPEKLLALRELCRGYDKTVIQYHESFFYRSTDTQYRIGMHRAFEELFRSVPGIELVCHEIKFPEGKDSEAERRAKVKKWLAAPKVLFHTRIERANYCRALGIREEESRTELVSPHKYYTKNRDVPVEQARAELGIPAEQKVFLCIGFIQPHKAFDKVAEAFERIASPGNRHLYIVGSLRIVTDETRLYLRTLEKYSERNANVHLVSSYISDEAFDTWLIAADCVVLPYREIWSSGVMARSKLFEKPCIVRDVGGLSEQSEAGDLLFREYDELPGLLERY